MVASGKNMTERGEIKESEERTVKREREKVEK